MRIWMLLLLLSGCSHYTQPDDPRFAPVMPDVANLPKPSQGSLYTAVNALSLYEDIKAYQVGDIITIDLTEKTQAKKDSKTDLTKTTNTNMNVPSAGILGQNPQFNLPEHTPLDKIKNVNLNANLSGNNTFKGGADSSQNNELTGQLSVTVAQVLPNRNLSIRGEKWITLNQGSEYVRITGIVRPIDVGPDNTVPSTKVANARISYSGTGALADANAMGWLARFFNSPLYPF
jgi:flagellar L-ring protein precursor FlgH